MKLSRALIERDFRFSLKQRGIDLPEPALQELVRLEAEADEAA
jgi:hypothetical protein